MVPLTSLLLPILLSAVIVFVASSLIHMVLGYHAGDYAKVPAEADVMDALRKFNIPPGDYLMPRPESMSAMNSPEFIEKRTKGPVALFTIFPPGPPSMAQPLAQWFLFSVGVSIVAAYIAGRALGPGADYLSVFRFAGTTAFASYSLGYWPQSIWYKRKWSTTLKITFDGLVYGLLTGGMFGWLWPR
jgi:hypothetical protein